MRAKSNTQYAYSNAKYCDKQTPKNPEAASLPFVPQTPNLENKN